MDFDDLTYTARDGIATITINRPEVSNAVRARTTHELYEAFKAADADREIGAVILTGAGSKAFCAGGDQKEREEKEREVSPDSPPAGIARWTEAYQTLRNLSKPVIAAANGAAVAAGVTLQLLCDVTIASETARWRMANLRVGGVDVGWGTNLLARAIGEKRAREMWFRPDRIYSSSEALEMGLVNKVVAPDQLMSEAESWASDMLGLPPSGFKAVKRSFLADTELAAITGSLHLARVDPREKAEGLAAFRDKREPDYSRFRNGS